MRALSPLPIARQVRWNKKWKDLNFIFYDNNNDPILFSQYLDNEHSNTITFDENVEENENSQFNLSFFNYEKYF